MPFYLKYIQIILYEIHFHLKHIQRKKNTRNTEVVMQVCVTSWKKKDRKPSNSFCNPLENKVTHIASSSTYK